MISDIGGIMYFLVVVNVYYFLCTIRVHCIWCKKYEIYLLESNLKIIYDFLTCNRTIHVLFSEHKHAGTNSNMISDLAIK